MQRDQLVSGVCTGYHAEVYSFTHHQSPAGPYELPMNGKQQIIMGTAKSTMM